MSSTGLTTGQAAAAFGVSIDTVRRWAQRGDLKPLLLASGHRRFDAAEVKRALESGLHLKVSRLPRGASASERFWSKVAGGTAEECWVWTGALKRGGYGHFREGNKQWTGAHRFAYRDLVGEIPEGLDLDHLCRNRACVNPWHLEPVTRQINILRGDAPALASARGRAKVACLRGHSLTDPGNVTIGAAGRRHCLACRTSRRDEQQRRSSK